MDVGAKARRPLATEVAILRQRAEECIRKADEIDQRIEGYLRKADEIERRARNLIARAKRIFGTDSDVDLAHRAALVVALAGEGEEPGVLAAREVLEALSAAPTEALLAEVGGYDRFFARLKESDAEGGEAIRCV